MDPILIVGLVLFGGFVFGEIATKMNLPKVTGYLLAGVLLNPTVFNFIPKDAVNHTNLITNISLAFITFSIGGTLVYSQLKALGKSILYITLFEAEFALIALVAGFLIVSPFLVHVQGGTWISVFIPLSILMGCLGSPTDPSPMLAVSHQYNAKGPVTSTILSVGASDDVMGIINYSITVVIAQAFVLHKAFSLSTTILKPLLQISGSFLLGIIFGFLFILITWFIRKEKEGVLIVLVFGLLSVCTGVANLLNVDELLSTMTMGAVVANFHPRSEAIFKMLERYTEELIFVLFFTISGMILDFGVLLKSLPLVFFFIIFRLIGKFTGTYVGGSLSHAPAKVKKYTIGGLVPLGGIVVGLALLMKQDPTFSKFSDIILSVIIGSTILHEFIGPISGKWAIKEADEIEKTC
ncbi:MAG: cation:proton antiporter [Candidatus Aureabacteria bacterium]|nr:cation:proton antiporter [Candidatus Auribacterota bacterium]